MSTQTQLTEEQTEKIMGFRFEILRLAIAVTQSKGGQIDPESINVNFEALLDMIGGTYAK